MRETRPGHGRLSAGEVGALVGVPGTAIGQWARHGYVRASVDDGDPHVYGVEDVGEASVVAQLLARGVRHAEVRWAIAHLAGPWPLQTAELATTDEPRPRLVLEGVFVLGDRGWQRATFVCGLRRIGVRLTGAV